VETLTNPATGMTLKIVRSDESLLEMEAGYAPKSPAPPEHFHPSQEERFVILKGAMTARVAGEVRELRTGDTLVLPAGTPHSMWNAGDERAVVKWETRPALRTERLFRDLFALGARGTPTLADVLALIAGYTAEIRVAPMIDPEVADYYERAPEESRLTKGPFKLEFARTQELIERHAPYPPADVLDVGGGAGAYALWLAERGHRVQLIDASPRLIEEARKRSGIAGSRLVSCRVADARALPVADASVSLVLLLGPLYHLVEADDRRKAIAEAARVLAPGGVLVAAAISRWASVLDGIARNLLDDPHFATIVERDVQEGQHRNPTGDLNYFTTAYFHRPDELRDEIADSGLTIVGLYGIEGPGWMTRDFDERWSDPAKRETILRIARALESEPAMIGCSAHMLAVGRKR